MKRHARLRASLDALTATRRITSWDDIRIPEGRGWVVQVPGQAREILRTRDAEALVAQMTEVNAEQLTLI